MNWFRLAQTISLFGLLIASTPHAYGAEYRRQVDVELEAIPDASRYEIKVTRVRDGGQTGKPAYFKMRKPIWSAEIAPGLYLLQMRSYDDRDVAGDWSDPFEYWIKLPAPKPISPVAGVKVKANDDSDAAVEFKWEPVPGAANYRIEIMSEDETIRKEIFSDSPSTNVKLPVARFYRWRVFTRLKDAVDGEEPEATSEFTLMGAPLESPSLDRPLTKVVQEIKWDEIGHATAYSYVYSVLRADGKWVAVGTPGQTKDAKVAFDLSQPSGQYRLAVQAKAEKRQNSKVAKIDFEVIGGLRDPAAVESAVLKESLAKPSNFYAIASYLITQIDYSAKLYDRNTISGFAALSGTGRIGIGYQNPRKPWGTFGIVDMGGINIANKNFTFASLELQETYKLNLGGRGQSLIGGGFFYKEVPILQGSVAEQFEGVGKATTMGPHIGIQYWQPFSLKFGVQLNARVYYSMLGNADEGGSLKPTMSFQYGVLGSYRLGPQSMGYAGYAYRADHVQYESATGGTSLAPPGAINEINMQGHFLNLLLEYSF